MNDDKPKASLKERLQQAKKNANGDPFNFLGDAESSAAAVKVARDTAEQENTPEAWRIYREALAEHEANHGPLS